MKIFSFSELETILRFSVRNVNVPTRKIADEIGFSHSGMNCWLADRNHISVEKGDKLIEWFKNNHNDILEMAIKCFSN